MADTENGDGPRSGGPGDSGEAGTAREGTSASPGPDGTEPETRPAAEPLKSAPGGAAEGASEAERDADSRTARGSSAGEADSAGTSPERPAGKAPEPSPAHESPAHEPSPDPDPASASAPDPSDTADGDTGAAGGAPEPEPGPEPGSEPCSEPGPQPEPEPTATSTARTPDEQDGAAAKSTAPAPEPRPESPAFGTASDGASGTAPGRSRSTRRDSAHVGAPDPTGPAPRGLTTEEPRRPRPFGGGLLMGRPFGVPVYVAPSWFLVAALITWVFGGQLDRVLPHLGALRYVIALFFAVAFYASVLVHELAHTVAALRFKLPVRRIQLQFFGGVSEIEKEAETPGREFWLAFVGPLLSLVLAGIFYAGMQTVEPGTVPGVLLAGLMISNLIVAAFNLLPGLPLDGGRMLRALIWKLSGRPMTGTVFAAWIGRVLAVGVLIGLPLATYAGGMTSDQFGGVDSLMDALLAAILAAIIWTGAGNSLRMARLREHLPELRARTLTRRAVPVPTDTPLSEALRRANEAGARALVVVDGAGAPVSLVREAAIASVPEHRRPWVAVSGLAQELREGMRVPAELAGEELLEHLRATPASEYLVVEETGEIYGVLSTGDVERAFVAAMAKPKARTKTSSSGL